MEEFVARQNIRRFQAQLHTCDDPQARTTLERLLEAEQQRLAQAHARKRGPAKA